MQLRNDGLQDISSELAVINRLLHLERARVLELGCGAAEKTRQIAEQTAVAEIVAVEIDPRQHEKNLTIDDLPNVDFKSYGAEEIPEADNHFDVVLMFKSLHHVPVDSLDEAMREIHRVLKPGGRAYFSEPVFDGAFNEIMRLFHDEEVVRRLAFDALKRAGESSLFNLETEYFFKNVIRLKSWEQYQNGILNVTHTDHQLSDEILAEVKKRFLAHEGKDGFVFEIPNRVDVLKKEDPSAG
jgi:SAM-dependent methyltransferase